MDNKETTIIINGRQFQVPGKEISFSQVVALAFPTPPTGQNIMFSVTYRRGHGDKPEGTLVEGQSTKLKEGMIFNVTSTDKS